MPQLKLTLPIFFLVIAFLGINSEPELDGHGNTDSVSNEEQRLIEKLRPLVENILYKDYMKADTYLVRFLRARDYKISQAKKMVEEVIEWRKDNKMDTILLEDFSDIDKQLPVVLDGSADKYGHPLLFINIGAINVRKIVLSGKMENFLRLYDAALELFASIVREMNLETKHKNITKGFIIIDLNGFNLRQHACSQCLSFIPNVVKGLELHYPDLFHKAYVINTPKAFLPIFDLSYSFLSKSTSKTFRHFDHDSDKWKKVLLSEIPANNLPVLYGGNKTDVIVTTLMQIKNTNAYAKAVFQKLLLQNKEA